MSMEAWRGFRKELWVEAEHSGRRRWMGWVAVFACCTVGAEAAEMSVEGDVGASERTKGYLLCSKVDAKAAVGGMAKIIV